MKIKYSLAVTLLLAVFTDAQTQTIVNNAGATVVEVVTENVAGIPTTQVLQTLGGSTATSQTLTTTSNTNPLLTTATLATTTTTTTPAQGPVAQPATTPQEPGGPTPYEYTTTDANGNRVVTQGTFTPTGPQTMLPAPTTTGTILAYSQWLSMIGTHTASAARHVSMPVATGWYYFAASALAGLVGGAWLIVL